VYGLLRTADSASPIQAPAVAASLAAFVLVYFAVFGAGVFYMLRLMRRPPETLADIAEIGITCTAGTTPGPAEFAPGEQYKRCPSISPSSGPG
jgi:cytochrome bd ubiquinol oxidase subunit I